jgi:hypothetical protein
MFRWGLSSIKFSGGEVIPLEPDSTLIIVGPNSSGKTSALSDIFNILGGGSNYPVVSEGEFFLEGDEMQYREWLRVNHPHIKNPLTAGDDVSAWYAISGDWNTISQAPHVFRTAGGFFFLYIDTTTRLKMEARFPSMDFNAPHPEAYIHRLQLDPKLKKQASDESQKAFQAKLEINEAGGPQVWFHWGNPPSKKQGQDPREPEYREGLNKTPLLAREGDGVRAYVQLLLDILCGKQPVLMIDEPELFLHPKQAERMGEMLASRAEREHQQIIIATHSNEIVRGAIAASTRVSVCRLTRKEDKNHAALLNGEGIKTLWAKPMLRSISSIQAFFYPAVVICEAEADSRFYEAVLRRLEQENLENSTDLYFASGGGKGEIATLIGAYKSLRIKVAAIADIDLLRQKGEFKKAISVLGGDFAQIEDLYDQVANRLGEKAEKGPIDFVAEARNITDAIERDGITREHRDKFIALLSDTAKWSTAKKRGISMLDGDEREAAESLLSKCKSLGLFLVPWGELECWWPGGPAKNSTNWVERAVVELFTRPALFQDALGFMDEIRVYLNRHP